MHLFGNKSCSNTIECCTSQKCSLPNASTSCNTKKNPPTLSNFPLARKKTWARNLRHFFLSNTTKRGKKRVFITNTTCFVTSRWTTITIMIIQHLQAMSLHQNRFYQHPGSAENSKEMLPAKHWTVVLRTYCRQTLSLLQFFPFETSATCLLLTFQ